MGSAAGAAAASDVRVNADTRSGTWAAIRTGAFVVWGSRGTGARSAVLAADLGVSGGATFMASPGTPRRPAPWRYLRHAWQTVSLLARRRPRVIFVQSPPSYPAWLATAYARLTKSAVVIDAHSAAFQVRAWSRPRWVHERVVRAAVATLVTDEHWAAAVEGAGGIALVVPDVPADYPRDDSFPRSERFTVALVAAWSPDEPIGEVLAAASRLPDVDVVITGRPRVDPASVPPNVRLAGFLPDRAYYALLASADAVMCLTTRDHTMQRGACEAVSLGRPVITSDWPLLRSAFPLGATFADNTAAGIAAAVARVRDEQQRFRSEAETLRRQRRQDWAAQRELLAGLIERRLASRHAA